MSEAYPSGSGSSALEVTAWRGALPPFVASRLLLICFSWAGLIITQPLGGGRWRAFLHCLILDGWARWDSGWYVTIALDGYWLRPGQESNVAFFPLYPILVRPLAYGLSGWLAPHSAFFLSGICVSLASFYLALVGLYRLCRPAWGSELAHKTLWLVSLFPFSFFFSAVYSESLFLALAVWAFVFAHEQRRWIACLLAALAGVTRIPGFIVAIALAFEYLQQRGWNPRGWRRDVLAFLVTPLPLLGLLAYFHARFSDPLVFIKAQATWHKGFGLSPLISVLNSLSDEHQILAERFQNLFYVVAVFGALALGALGARRLGVGLAAFAILSGGLVALTGFEGAGRFVSVTFPAFIAAAMWLDRRGMSIALLASLPLLLWFTWEFTHWWHVT